MWRRLALKKTMLLVLIFPIVINAFLVGILPNAAVGLSITDISVSEGFVEGGTEIVVRGDFQVNQITAGEYHTCTIDADGLAYCWGENGSGQLGNDSTSDAYLPVAVDASGDLIDKRWASISAGASHTCAIDSSGLAYCWGSDSNGQLGSDAINLRVPTAVDISGVLAGKKLVFIESGDFHTCAIDMEGKAYCWGDNARGQLGDGSTLDSSAPVAVDASGVLAGKALKRIAAGYTHTCAIDYDGKVYCWGDGGIGRLGNGATDSSSVPVAVDDSGVLAGKTLVDISASQGYTCAVDSEGLGYCWGWNQYGQFGSGEYSNSSVPVAMDVSEFSSDLPGEVLTRIDAGMAHACGIGAGGSAYCWGFDGQGQLGTGAVYMQSLSAVAVDMTGVLDGKLLMRVASGAYHTCALDSDGRVYCWGEGSSGQLGNSLRLASLLPVQVYTAADTVDLPVVSALPADTLPTYKVVLDANGSPAECEDVVVNALHTVLTCITTAHLTGGTVDLTVSDGVGASVLPSAFTYLGIGVPDTGSV